MRAPTDDSAVTTARVLHIGPGANPDFQHVPRLHCGNQPPPRAPTGKHLAHTIDVAKGHDHPLLRVHSHCIGHCASVLKRPPCGRHTQLDLDT